MKGGAQQWEDKLIEDVQEVQDTGSRNSLDTFLLPLWGPEPEAWAWSSTISYLGREYRSGVRKSTSTHRYTQFSIQWHRLKMNLPLFPSGSVVGLSGLWRIRLLYLASTSCKRIPTKVVKLLDQVTPTLSEIEETGWSLFNCFICIKRTSLP